MCFFLDAPGMFLCGTNKRRRLDQLNFPGIHYG